MTMGTFALLTSCGGDKVVDGTEEDDDGTKKPSKTEKPSDSASDSTQNSESDSASDNGNGESDNGESDVVDSNEKVTVVRAITLVERGKALSNIHLQEIEVDPSVVPEGAIRTIKEVKGKFTNVVLYPGDYIFADKILAEKDESMETGSDKYAVLTSFCGNKSDISGELQEYIDNNPNTTIYIPDGIYQTSKPINIPTAPGKSVSIRMSYRAIIQTHPTKWDGKGDAIFHIGTSAEKPSATKTPDTCSITGGILETNKKATGIIVEGAGNVLIANMSIKSAEMGIHIKTSNVDVDNVVVTGTESLKSTGVKVDGSHNTVSNMRIYKINTGIHLTKGNNVLRNLHPLLAPAQADKDTQGTTYGFYDESKDGNYYDYCYSDQLSIGFWLADGNTSILNGCFAYWYKDSAIHYGAYVNGNFDAIIRNCRFDLCNDKDVAMNPVSAYLVVKNNAGKGMVVSPIAGSGYDSICALNTFRK